MTTRMIPTSPVDFDLVTVRQRPRRARVVARVIEDQEVCEGGLDALLYDYDGIADIAPRRLATGISAERAADFVSRLHEAAAYLEQAAVHIARRAAA